LGSKISRAKSCPVNTSTSSTTTTQATTIRIYLGYRRNIVCSSCYHRLAQHQVKHIFVVLIVEPEAKLVHVSLQILHRDMVVDSIDPTLEDRPEGLYIVSMNKIIHKAFSVVNYQVNMLCSSKNIVSSELVSYYGALPLAYLIKYSQNLVA